MNYADQKKEGRGVRYLPEPGYKRVLVCAAYTVLAVAVIYLVSKYLLDWLLPFVIAWVMSLLVQPVILCINKKTGTSKKFLGVLFISLLVVAVFGGLFLVCNRLYFEIREFVAYLSESADSLIGQVFDFFDNLGNYIPFLSAVEDAELNFEIQQRVSEIIFGAVSEISSKLPVMMGSFISMLPRVLFFVIILVMASFYICADFEYINKFLAAQLPPKAQQICVKIKRQILSTGFHYLRAYLTLMLYTFIQLLIGFIILDIDYALTLAIIIAVVDAFPILGVGTVLFPWSAVLLIQGNYYTGFGLIIIYAVVALIRQIIEPRIVGGSIGLHPLVTLIAMYAGYRIIGIGGLFLMPIIVILLKNLNDGGTIKLWKNVSEDKPVREREIRLSRVSSCKTKHNQQGL